MHNAVFTVPWFWAFFRGIGEVGGVGSKRMKLGMGTVRAMECGSPQPCHFDRVNTLWEIMETFYSAWAGIKRAFLLIHQHWLLYSPWSGKSTGALHFSQRLCWVAGSWIRKQQKCNTGLLRNITPICFKVKSYNSENTKLQGYNGVCSCTLCWQNVWKNKGRG